VIETNIQEYGKRTLGETVQCTQREKQLFNEKSPMVEMFMVSGKETKPYKQQE
jgi:hypothetical protein